MNVNAYFILLMEKGISASSKDASIGELKQHPTALPQMEV